MRAVTGAVKRPMELWACRWPEVPQAAGCCGFGDPPVAVEAYQFADQDAMWLAGVLHRVECAGCGGSVIPCVEWVVGSHTRPSR